MRTTRLAAITAALLYGATSMANAATLAKVRNATGTDLIVNGTRLPSGDYLYAQIDTIIRDATDTKGVISLHDHSVRCTRKKGYNGWSSDFTGWLIEGRELDPNDRKHPGATKPVDICLGTSVLFEIYCISASIQQTSASVYPFMVLHQLAEKECGSERLYNAIHGR